MLQLLFYFSLSSPFLILIHLALLQCFTNDDYSLKIATKNAVLLKIQGLSMSEGNLYAIGTIKEDYLGPTEN